MNINLGPISFRAYADTEGYSNFVLGFTTNRHGGDAARETAIRAGFKSEHITQWIGEKNLADKFEDPATGTLYFGRFCKTPTGVFYINAKSVYMQALYQRAVRSGLEAAEQATGQGTASNAEPTPTPTARTAAKRRARKAATPKAAAPADATATATTA